MRRPRRSHTAFKAKVALAALKGDQTLAEKFDAHSNQTTQWKTRLLTGAIGVFTSPAEKRGTEQGPSAKEMQAKIGPLALEADFSYGPSLQAERRFRIPRLGFPELPGLIGNAAFWL